LTGFASGQTQEVFLLNERHAPWLKNERVPLDPGWERNLIAVGAFMMFGFLVGLYMLYDNLQTQSIAQQLEQSGLSIQASVTDQRVETNDRNAYYITYSFQPDPTLDQVYSKESWVSRSYYNEVILSEVVDVRYLPDKPEVSDLVDFPRVSRFPLYTIVILFLGPPVVLWILFRAKIRQDRFGNEGQVIRGELLEFKSRMNNGNYMVTTRYRFRSPLGSPLEGKSSSAHNNLRNTSPPASGTPVAVLYVDDKLHRLL